MIFKTGTRFLTARVTHLEMHTAMTSEFVRPPDESAHMLHAPKCPLHFYRYLYKQIGKAHHWTQRLKMDDATLEKMLHNPQTLLQIFYVDGCPAGFTEVTLRAWPVAEILYFGLIADFQGRGLSSFFFSEMLTRVWTQKPEKLIIQTNTLDSPLALKLYQKMGFEVVSTRDIVLESWPDGYDLD